MSEPSEETKKAITKITKKIVGFQVKKPEESLEKKEDDIDLEYMHEKFQRPTELKGTTYKIKPMGSDSALYMTINDVILNEGTENEHRQPYEMFLASKHMQSYQWISLVTRLVSAVFRKGGNIKFVVNEFEAIFDPAGGYWGKLPKSDKGKYYNSVIAELGAILRHHMAQLNLTSEPKEENKPKITVTITDEPIPGKTIEPEDTGKFGTAGISCPDCNSKNVNFKDGCPCCQDCGWSKCS